MNARQAEQISKAGLDGNLLQSLRRQIEDYVAEHAEALYGTEAGLRLLPPALKDVEKHVVYYDYEACCASVLGRMAAAGSQQSWPLIERILENTETALTPSKSPAGRPVPVRRLPLHLARCYQYLQLSKGSAAERRFREVLERMGTFLIEHFKGFHPGLRQLHNVTVSTGINHVAVGAEGLWLVGHVLGRAEWQRTAEDFAERLLAWGHPDGYFEENTNDAREGGPSLCYTRLTAGALYHIFRWRGDLPRERFLQCGRFTRMMTDANLRDLMFADERTNILRGGMYGVALHSLSPEGRGYLRILFTRPGFKRPPRDRMESFARLDHELDGVETGPGALPEPWIDGVYRLQLPLGVYRAGGWTIGLSALRALNRVLRPGNDYALDRQSLLYLSHAEAGVILAGMKSKGDPEFSTLRAGQDAWPVRTGSLEIDEHRMTARVFYETFQADLTWHFGPEPTLTVTTDPPRPFTVQLVLEVGYADRLVLNDSGQIELADGDHTVSDVSTVAAHGWSARSNRPGTLRWPVRPHNPYTTGNVAPKEQWRAVWVIPCDSQAEFRFRAGA